MTRALLARGMSTVVVRGRVGRLTQYRRRTYGAGGLLPHCYASIIPSQMLMLFKGVSCIVLVVRKGVSRREEVEDDSGHGLGSLWCRYVRHSSSSNSHKLFILYAALPRTKYLEKP